jgi:hypothetical protein
MLQFSPQARSCSAQALALTQQNAPHRPVLYKATDKAEFVYSWLTRAKSKISTPWPPICIPISVHTRHNMMVVIEMLTVLLIDAFKKMLKHYRGCLF